MNSKLVIAIGLAVSASARPGHAQPETGDTVGYRVKQGDSLELVAAEFYGDHTDAELIVTANKWQRWRALKPGERIRVPVTRQIVTAKGDSLESLAQTYLGDPGRAKLLAEFNNMAIDDAPRLPAGIELAVPIQVTHVAPFPESLANISNMYFGDGKQADMLRSYNALDKQVIDKGESMLIPMANVRVRDSRLPALDDEAKARRDERHRTVELAATALPKARGAWAQGDFATVRAALTPVLEELDFLDTKPAVDVALLVARADVAFDDEPRAAAALAQVLDRKPRFRLSPYSESPKLIAAWKNAGGHLDGEP